MDVRELNDGPPNAKGKECLPAFVDPLNASAHDLPEIYEKMTELQDSYIIVAMT
jgi:hypothetical protein